VGREGNVYGMPQKETLDKAAYTCLLVSYQRLSAQFQFSLSAVTLVYLSQCSRQLTSTYLYCIYSSCTV
jgi:hypothetical protein